jgi:aspartate carbamoyltransferase catalytic subunit
MRHIIDLTDMSMEDWNGLYAQCHEIMEHTDDFKDACRGKLMASFFYEPSTRTSFSFQAAMQRLGGGFSAFRIRSPRRSPRGNRLRIR